MSKCDQNVYTHQTERKTLIALFAINGMMFLTEIIVGWFAQSTGLIADALDMFADASVYALTLFVVDKAIHLKAKAAFLSGLIELLLALSVLIEVIRRFIWGSDPQSLLMIAMGIVALMANMWCLRLLAKHRQGEVHMRASWIFSLNDVIANLGVIISGILVGLIGSRYPDLVMGGIISILVARGGFQIISEAHSALK
jgi:cation diffusion facilitator family transporter